MAAIKSSSQLLGNSAWNASSFIVGVGLNLLVLPFVLFRLGAAAFGVAGLVTACIAPALAFSNALALSTTRELAQRLAPGERDDARRFFATALLLAGAGGLPIAIVLSLAGPVLAHHVFHLRGEVTNDLALAFVFGSSGWLCQCISAVFLALLTARQDYARLALINVVITVVSTLSILVLIPRWPQASTFLGCQALDRNQVTFQIAAGNTQPRRQVRVRTNALVHAQGGHDFAPVRADALADFGEGVGGCHRRNQKTIDRNFAQLRAFVAHAQDRATEGLQIGAILRR